MKRKEIVERISVIPAWALSPLAAVIVSVIVGIFNFIDIPYTYFLWALLNATASFLICIIHPKHVWIVPLLCNMLIILPAATGDTFWTSSFGIIMGIVLVHIRNPPPSGVVMFCRLCLYLLHGKVQKTVSCGLQV